MIRILVFAASVAAVGCNSSRDDSEDKCAKAANKAVDQVIATRKAQVEAHSGNLPTGMQDRLAWLDTQTNALKNVLAKRCTEDKWAEDVIDCYAAARSQKDLQICRRKLPQGQAAQLQQDQVQAMVSGSSVLGGSGQLRVRRPDGFGMVVDMPSNRRSGSAAPAAGTGSATGPGSRAP